MCEHHLKTDPVSIGGMHRRDLVRGLWTGSLLLTTAGCASAAKYFAPSDADLMTMSAEAWTQTKTQTPISKDAKGNKRLQTIGPKIAAVANLPNAQWEYVLFDSKELNAWVLPGGKVGFYKGLMDFCDTDDQVAAVIGHETGHVAKRHAALRAGEQQAESLGVGLASAVLNGRMSADQLSLATNILGMGLNVTSALPFSRSHEAEADKVGVDYMHAAGYNVNEAVKLWEKMSAASASRPPEFLSTHPDPVNRAQNLRDYIKAQKYA
jgi:predicted Zn-dependent protease